MNERLEDLIRRSASEQGKRYRPVGDMAARVEQRRRQRVARRLTASGVGIAAIVGAIAFAATRDVGGDDIDVAASTTTQQVVATTPSASEPAETTASTTPSAVTSTSLSTTTTVDAPAAPPMTTSPTTAVEATAASPTATSPETLSSEQADSTVPPDSQPAEIAASTTSPSTTSETSTSTELSPTTTVGIFAEPSTPTPDTTPTSTTSPPSTAPELDPRTPPAYAPADGSPVWPYGPLWNVPQLGQEDKVRGTGCGSNGLGETIPDGLWAGYITSQDGTNVAVDILCIYAVPDAAALGEQANVVSAAPNYVIVNNNTRTRTMPMHDNIVLRLGRPEGGECVDGTPTTQWGDIPADRQVWLRIHEGRVTWILADCPP